MKNKQANDRIHTYVKTHIFVNIMTQRVDLVLDLRTNKGTHPHNKTIMVLWRKYLNVIRLIKSQNQIGSHFE